MTAFWRRLLRWLLLSDLDPETRADAFQRYKEQSTALSLTFFLVYFILKIVWLPMYASTSFRTGFDAAKWRALLGQGLQLLVIGYMLTVGLWRYHENRPICLPLWVFSLPTMLMAVTTTLHLESIRLSIDRGDMMRHDGLNGHSCDELIADYRVCAQIAAQVFMQHASNTSEGYQTSYSAAWNACSYFPVIAKAESQTNVIRDACLWKCFDSRTLTTLTLEFISHFLVLLPAEVGTILVLPSWLIVAAPTRVFCGADKWLRGNDLLLDAANDSWHVGSSGSPFMLLAVCLFCLGISCVRGRLQLEVAKQVPPDASGPICGGC